MPGPTAAAVAIGLKAAALKWGSRTAKETLNLSAGQNLKSQRRKELEETCCEKKFENERRPMSCRKLAAGQCPAPRLAADLQVVVAGGGLLAGLAVEDVEHVVVGLGR